MFEEDEDLLGGSPDYGRPTATFSEDSVASSYAQPSPQDVEFQGLQANLDLLNSSKDISYAASEAAKKFREDKDRWGKDTFSQFYSPEIRPTDLSPDEMLIDLQQRADMTDAPPDPQFEKAKNEWAKRVQQQASYDEHETATGLEYARLSSLKSQLAPSYLSAFENWKASSGGKKPNGKNSVYMDPEKANEVLDFLDLPDPTYLQIENALKPGGLEGIDPRYQFKGESKLVRAKNELQLERRKALMRGDMEAAWKEVSRAERLRAAGYQAPPSWQNAVGGVSRHMSKPGEAREILINAAENAGFDYFTDPDSGQKINIQDYIKTSPYTPEERQAVGLMNQLFNAKTEYDDLQIKFWSNFDKYKDERDEDDVWGQMQLAKQKRDSLTKQLSTMGYGRELINRTDSLRDMDWISGAWKKGDIQGDMSDFSRTLFTESMGEYDPNNPDAKGTQNWQNLANLAEQQDLLSQYLADNDMSPLAKMSRLSAEQKDDWLAAVGRWFGIGDGSDPMDGVKALAEITVNQLSGFMWEYFAGLPTTSGAMAVGYGAAGALTGPGAGAFAVTGAAHGARLNWGITSAAMEYTATILEAMKEEGVDVHNARAFSLAWMNDEIKQKVRAKAAKKTGVVAIFDTASGILGGNVSALFKTPAAVTKIPGSVGVGKQNLKGLTKAETNRLTELRKAKRKGKVQRDSELDAEMMNLESKVQKGRLGTAQLDNDFSRALAKSDATVNRTTWKHRFRNAALEGGVQAGLGGGGELLSQAFANDPGQEIDKQSVFAEIAGEVASAPSLYGYAQEVRKKPSFKDYRNAVVEGEEQLAPGKEGDGDYALRGGGTRTAKNMQGWQFNQVRYDDFTDAVKDVARQLGMPMYVTDEKGQQQLNPEIMFQNELVSGIQNLLKPKGLTLEFVVSDRTPSSENSYGEMQTQLENDAVVIFLNKKQLLQDGENLTGVLLHEIGHAYGEGIVGRDQLLRYYRELTPDQQKQSFAYYKFKDQFDFVDANKLPNPVIQREFDKEWQNVVKNKDSEYARAQEWFSFEFARVLAGSQRDYGTVPSKGLTKDSPDIPGPQQSTERVPVQDPRGNVVQGLAQLPAGEAANIRLFIDSYIHPLMSKWIGSGVREDRPNRPIGEDVSDIQKPVGDIGRKAQVQAPNNVQMDAEILAKMQFGISPSDKLVYMGKEDKAGPWQVGMDFGGMAALGDMRNKLLDQEQYIKDISTVLGEGMGKRMLKERVETTYTRGADGKVEDFGPLGEAYRVVEANENDLGLVETEDVERLMQQGLQRERDKRLAGDTRQKSKLDPKTGNIVESERPKIKLTGEQKKARQASILKEMDDLDRKKKIQALKKDPKALKGQEPVGEFSFANRAAEVLSKAIQKAQKQEKDRGTPQKIRFKKQDYSIADAIQLRDAYSGIVGSYKRAASERVAQEEAELNVSNKFDPKKGVFRPAMEKNKEGALQPDFTEEVDYSDQSEMATLASIEGTNKLLKERGTSLAKVNQKMDKIIEMDEKELLNYLKKDIDDLFVQKGGRATFEELFGVVARKTGMDAVADAQLDPARAALTDSERITTDLNSVLEAYETLAYEEGSKKVELIQNKIDQIQGTIAAERQNIKKLEADSKISDEDSKDVSKTVNALKTALRSFKSKGPETGLADKEELRKFLLNTITAPDASEVAKGLSEFLSGPVIGTKGKEVKAYAQKLDMLTQDISNMPQTAETAAKVSAMKEDFPSLIESIQTIKGIKNEDQKQKIAGAKAEIESKQKNIEELQDVKSSIASVSETVDIRRTPALVKFTPDDAKSKGINFGDMRLVSYDKKEKKKTITEQKVTLEDLANNDKLEVAYYKSGKESIFEINGKKELSKLADNFDWAMDDAAMRAFESETGQNYKVYRSHIWAALTAMREGKTKMTRFGPQSTAYYKIDEGVTKPAIVMERILRLPGLYKRLETKAEKKGGEDAVKALEKEYGTFGLLEQYEDYTDRVQRANQKILSKKPEYIIYQSRKKQLIEALGLKTRPGKFEDVGKLLNQDSVKRLRKQNKLAAIYKDIDEVVGKGKLSKKITFGELENALGLGRRKLQEIRKSADLEKPTDLLAEDRMAVNITNSRLAEALGEADTEKIGGGRFNKQDQAIQDFVLFTERELLNDLNTKINAVESGLTAAKQFSKDAFIKAGETFYWGGRLYKAHKNIDRVGSFVGFDITEYANPATNQLKINPDGKVVRVNPSQKIEEGTVPLTAEQRKEFERDIKLLQKRLKALNKIYEFEFHRSDLNAAQTKYKNQAGYIEQMDRGGFYGPELSLPYEITSHEYKHLLMRMHEEIALSGANKAFQDSLAGGRTTGNMFDHYNTANINIKEKMRTQKLNSVSQLTPLSDQKAIAILLDDLISITKKREQEQNFNEYQPDGIDRGFDMGQLYVEMLANNDMRLPLNRRGVLYKGTWYDDLDKIKSDDKLRQAYEEQVAEHRNLANKLKLPLSLDFHSVKGDPVVRALGLSYDDNRKIHDDVRNHLQREAAEREGAKKNGRIAIKINKRTLSKLPKNTKIKPNEDGDLVVYWNENITSPHTPYIQQAVTGETFLNELKASLNRMDRVLVRRDESIIVNGYKYKAQNDITRGSSESNAFQEIFETHAQLGSVRKEADLQKLVQILEKSTSFKKNKKRVTNPAERVGLFHNEIENQLDRKRALAEKLKLEIEERKNDIGPDSKNERKKAQNLLDSVELELATVKDFREGKLKEPGDWYFNWYQGDETLQTRIIKEKDDFVIQVFEPGGFQKKDKNRDYFRNLSEEENNILLSLYAAQYALKPDTLVGKPRDDVSQSQVLQNLGSLTITPRQLAQKIFDSGGVDRMLLLSGNHSRYYAEAEGGFPLLEWVTHLPDLMLDTLEKADLLESREKQLKTLLDIYKKTGLGSSSARREHAFIKSRLEKLESDKEAGVNYSTKVLLNYVANFRMENAKKMAPVKAEEGGLSKADLNMLNTLISSKQTQNFYVATREQKFRQGEVIKVGQIQAVKDADGKVIQKGFPAYARVHIDDNMKDADGNPKAMSASDFLDAEDAPSNTGTLKSRWPSNKSKEASKKENEEAEQAEATFAFPYRLELVYDESKIEATFQEAELASFKEHKKEEKANASQLLEIARKIDEQGGSAATVLERRKASKFARDLFYLENDYNFYDQLIKDVTSPNSKYMRAKLKAVLQAVWDMGGLNVVDEGDIMASEQKVQQDAEDSNQGMGGQKEDLDSGIDPDIDDPEFQQDQVDKDDRDYEDIGQSFSSTYDQAMFTRPLSQNILSKIASKITSKYEAWRLKAKASDIPPNELDLGQKTGRKVRDFFKAHDGLYGGIVEQFGPWMKAQDHIIEKLGLDKKGETAKMLNLYDVFYQQMGVAGNLLDEGQRVFINPISDALYDSKAELEDVGMYLYSLVAPQANAAVRRNREKANEKPLLNEKGEDVGSGMSNSEAKEQIQRLEKKPEMQRFIMHKNNPIRTMFKMHQKALDVQLQSEMLDKKSHERMEAAAKIANKEYDKSIHTIPVPDFGDFRRLPLRGLMGMEDQYVRQEEEHDILGSGTASGKGFDMPHGAVYKKNSMGRSFFADPEMIFAHATQSYQDAIIRSTRGKSAQAINNLYNYLHEFKIQAPDSAGAQLFDKFFEDASPIEIFKGDLEEKITNTNGDNLFAIKKMEIPAEIADSGRALFVREAGKPKLIMFSKKREGTMLASASKNLNYQQLGTTLGIINIFTKYDSKLRTSWSPNFWVRNPLRDMTNAWFNLDSEEDFKPIRNKVASPFSFMKHAGSIFSYEQSLEDHGKAPKDYASMETDALFQLAKTDIGAAYHVLRENGGKTAFYKFNELSELQEQGKKASEKPRQGGKIIKPLRAIKVFVDNLNTSIENVLRARVVMHGLAAGMDLETVIGAARDVTVDFNKRGTWSQSLGAVVQFANPGIQGNRRFAKSLKKRGLQASLKLGGKVLSASITYNLLMRALTAREDEDEDDRSTYYDDLSAHKRYTSIVMPHQLLGDDQRAPGYSEIPIGYGPHGMWALGDFIAKQMFTGGRDILEDSMEFTKVMYQTYSPYAPTSWGEIITPQPTADLVRQIAANEQWNGNTIYREYLGSDTASPSVLSKRNTPKIYKDIADSLNQMAGGNKQVPGNLLSMLTLTDPLEITGSAEAFTLGGAWSGSGLEFFTEAVAGDVVGGMMKAANWFSGDPGVPELPVISGIVKMRGSSFKTYQAYNSLATRAKQAKASLDAMDLELKKDFLKANKHYMKIIKAVEASEKAMSLYRRKRDALEKQDQKNERVIQELERLEVMRDNIQRRTIGLARDFEVNV